MSPSPKKYGPMLLERSQASHGTNSKSTFPCVLRSILDNALFDRVLWWNKDGDSFFLSSSACTKEFLGMFFKGKRFESLVRKLNRWGFKRSSALSRDGIIVYHHPLFTRARPEMLLEMKPQDRKKAARLCSHDTQVHDMASKQRADETRNDTSFVQLQTHNHVASERNAANSDPQVGTIARASDGPTPCLGQAILTRPFQGHALSPDYGISSNTMPDVISLIELHQGASFEARPAVETSRLRFPDSYCGYTTRANAITDGSLRRQQCRISIDHNPNNNSLRYLSNLDAVERAQLLLRAEQALKSLIECESNEGSYLTRSQFQTTQRMLERLLNTSRQQNDFIMNVSRGMAAYHQHRFSGGEASIDFSNRLASGGHHINDYFSTFFVRGTPENGSDRFHSSEQQSHFC